MRAPRAAAAAPLPESAQRRAAWRDLPARAIAVLRLWRRRMRESHELEMLSERELRDLGVTRYDAAQEARKAFWRV